MLMWEISSGQPPFANHENNYDLVNSILHGKRPKIVSGTPLEYKKIMKQCWDASPLKRPYIDKLHEIIIKLNKSNILNGSSDNKCKKFISPFASSSKTSLITNYSTSKSFTSKIYQFENLPEPRNATEGIV